MNVKTLGIWVVAFEAVPALQGRDSPTAYRILCVRLPYILFMNYFTPQ